MKVVILQWTSEPDSYDGIMCFTKIDKLLKHVRADYHNMVMKWWEHNMVMKCLDQGNHASMSIYVMIIRGDKEKMARLWMPSCDE